jgi:hypothetical protein
MGETSSVALMLTLLQHAKDFPWRMQDIGLLSLHLDDRREYRLHIWDPTRCDGEPPIHDHPYDFTSTVIAGRMTNVRYEEDPTGEDYVRFRFPPGAEAERQSDTVTLASTATTFTEGDQYQQLAPELHTSWQEPGTVTVIQCSWIDAPTLTVCLRDEASWLSGLGRDATRDEIKQFTAKALEWF